MFCVGAHLNSWGYKKAMLMNYFATDFRPGNSAWRRWFSFFRLEKVFTDSGFIAQEEMNRMYNRAAVIPVDGNPGIINGVHLRMFEALAAYCLIEYRNDVTVSFQWLKINCPCVITERWQIWLSIT